MARRRRRRRAWIRHGTATGLGITSGVPPVFEAYATVVLPAAPPSQSERYREVLRVLRAQTPDQAWLLGYLETSSDDDVVFPDAPRVTLYAGWRYVLVEAVPDQAARWRAEPRGSARLGPDLLFPVDRAWLVTHLWDDDRLCVGGPAALISGVVDALGPVVRRVQVDDEDATPPGRTAL